VLIGTFFRFYNIDRKVFWVDEIVSVMRINGYTESELVSRATLVKKTPELLELLHPSTSEPSRGISSTINSLAAEEPQHAPFYFVAAKLWAETFGDSIRSLRLFSALISMLALPCMYFLCMELFNSKIASRIGVALIALSPVQILYAQEIRDYSIWTVSMLFMSALLLFAIRLGTWSAWLSYCAALTVSLYIFPFSGLVALAQLVYLAVLWRARQGPRVLRALASITLGFALFTPWLVIVLRNRSQVDRAMNPITGPQQHVGVFGTIRSLMGLIRTDFIDLNLLSSPSINLILSIPAAILVFYAFYLMIRDANARVWLFVVTLTLATAAPLVLADLLLSGTRTGVPRYFMPLFIGIDLCLTYVFAKMITQERKPKMLVVWLSLAVVVLGARFVSCVAGSQARTWWNKGEMNSIGVAESINSDASALLISDGFLQSALSVAQYLRPDVVILVRPLCYLCHLPPGKFDQAALDFATADSRRVTFALGPSRMLMGQLSRALRSNANPNNYTCIDDKSADWLRGTASVNGCKSSLHLWPW
jgi:uncharacterized membrane protein